MDTVKILNLTEPKPKQVSSAITVDSPLPIPCDEGLTSHCTGYYTGFNVVIKDVDDILSLYKKGYFGKGSLSRSFPAYKKTNGALRFRQWKHRAKIQCTDHSIKNVQRKCIVIDDSDEADDCFDSLPRNPRFEDTNTVNEQLHLMLEEAFFLSYGLHCLHIYNLNNELMDVNTLWNTFREQQSDFIIRYVGYHYFRSKGWVVKSAIKYGADYALYMKGVPYYHASYVVVMISSDNSSPQINASYLSALNRSLQMHNKELLICKVVIPENTNMNDVTDLPMCQISEFHYARWIPTKHRQDNSS